MNMEKIREEFERVNSDRHWFVAGGRHDTSLEEGFEYEDYTTDMCWTCWVGSRAAIEVELPPIWEQGVNTATGQSCAQIRTADIEAIKSFGLKVKL